MKASKKIVNLEDVRRLKEVVDCHDAETAPQSLATVVDFGAHREGIAVQEAQRQRAQERSLSALKVLHGLVKDYEAQMLVIAHQYDRQQWIEQNQQDPYAQIDYDMKRLGHFLGGLRYALQEKGAATLQEACEVLRGVADAELISTMDYILESEYVGFMAMRHLIESIQINEYGYCEDVAAMGLVLKNLEQNNFLYSIEPLSTLCMEEAVAV